MAKPRTTKPKHETRRVDQLRAHPSQADMFGDLSDANFEMLVVNIEHRGLQEPIEILGPNRAGLPVDTIISGHQRWRAMKQLSRDFVDVKVLHDLAEASLAEIEVEFLDANENRRHLSKLERARVELRKYELEVERSREDLYGTEEVEARDRVGRRIGMSGRNLQRYFNVLKAPLAVQRSFDHGALALVPASRVSQLPPAVQSEIAERISAGGDAQAIVKEHLTSLTTAEANGGVLHRTHRLLEQAITELEPHLAEAANECGLMMANDILATLGRWQPLEKQLMKLLGETKKRRQARMDELLEEF